MFHVLELEDRFAQLGFEIEKRFFSSIARFGSCRILLGLRRLRLILLMQKGHCLLSESSTTCPVSKRMTSFSRRVAIRFCSWTPLCPQRVGFHLSAHPGCSYSLAGWRERSCRHRCSYVRCLGRHQASSTGLSFVLRIMSRFCASCLVCFSCAAPAAV